MLSALPLVPVQYVSLQDMKLSHPGPLLAASATAGLVINRSHFVRVSQTTNFLCRCRLAPANVIQPRNSAAPQLAGFDESRPAANDLEAVVIG